MGARDDSLVVCPFYKSDHKSSDCIIRCEGLLDDTIIHWVFAGGHHLKLHKEAYCRSNEHWKECPLSRALEEKYEDE